MDINNPVDSSTPAKPERDRCPIDFVFCNICSTAIYVEDLQDEDILCLECKAEVEYLRLILLDKKKYFWVELFSAQSYLDVDVSLRLVNINTIFKILVSVSVSVLNP